VAKKIFITATNTDVGKTYTSLKLIKIYSNLGYKVGVIKPIETGVVDSPLDATLLFKEVKIYNNLFHNLNINDIVPYQFSLPASPFVAKKNTNIDIKIINKAIQKLETYCDILIIEGAGGLMVPINKNYFMVDLIKNLKCSTLLISSSELGSINDTLLSQHLLRAKNINFEWIINLYKDKNSFFQTTAPFYEKTFANLPLLEDSLKKIALKLLR